ncbi:hypothetical protein ACEPAG_3537 [Sanghuangporus baumii]
MLVTLLKDLVISAWNCITWLWNLLPLPSSLKIKQHEIRSSNETRNGSEIHHDANGLSPEERKRQYLLLLRLLVALAIPVILETLDYTVVATAQPKIASAFNRLDLQSYIGTVYLLTSAVFLPLFASLADVFGRHSAMQLSLVFFFIGSAISTAAQDMPMMLAGRGVAGIGAAGLLTVLRTILADSRSLTLNNLQGAIMTILYAIGFCIGPVIGGALVNISFRWVFAINLPAAALSMVLIFILLRKHTKRPLQDQKLDTMGKLLHIDWTGAVFFTIGGIGLLLGLNWGSTAGWDDAKVIVALVVGVVLIGLTLAWEVVLEHKQDSSQTQVRGDPEVADGDATEKNAHLGTSVDRAHLAAPFRATALLPLKVMGNFDVIATNLAALTSGMVMLVVFYFVALYFIIVSGQSETHAGTQLLYFAPGLGIGTVMAIQMVSRLRQPKYPILLGDTIIPISLGLISMAINSNNERQIKGFMIMAGIGVGLTFGPIGIQARFSQPTERVAIVSALNLFFRSLGGTIGLAQCGTVTSAKVRAYFNGLPPSALAGLQGTNAASFTAAGLTSIDQIDSLPSEAQELVRSAFQDGVRWSFISLIPWACISFIACLFLRHIDDPDSARRRASEPVAQESVHMSDIPLREQGISDEVKTESKDTSNPTL